MTLLILFIGLLATIAVLVLMLAGALVFAIAMHWQRDQALEKLGDAEHAATVARGRFQHFAASVDTALVTPQMQEQRNAVRRVS